MKAKFVLFFALVTTTFAQDFVELYLKYGISAVEKELEKSIQDSNYWESYLKNKDLSFGFFQSNKYLVVSSKKQKIMRAYFYDTASVKKVFEENIIVGKDGDKQ